MSWNLFDSIRRTESGDGVGDAGCHEMDCAAAKRRLLSVNQTPISDAGRGPPRGAGMLGETETGALSAARAETPAPSTPRPRADVLMKVRLEPTFFICFMWSLDRSH